MCQEDFRIENRHCLEPPDPSLRMDQEAPSGISSDWKVFTTEGAAKLKALLPDSVLSPGTDESSEGNARPNKCLFSAIKCTSLGESTLKESYK